jgi:hypothetical protein
MIAGHLGKTVEELGRMSMHECVRWMKFLASKRTGSGKPKINPDDPKAILNALGL